MTAVLPDVALGLGAATVALLLLLVARRVQLARREQRQSELENRVVPQALELVSGDLPDDRAESLSKAEAEALATVLQRYARVLDGDDRRRIAAFFERAGLVSHEVGLLKSPLVWRRALAAYVLGDIGNTGAVPALIDALKDRHRDVRAAATRSLGKLGAAEAVEPLLSLMATREVPASAGSLALLQIGTDALPGILAVIAQGTEDERLAAMELLIELGDASHARILVECIGDPAPEVRARAARGLGRLGASAATRELRRALGDPDPAVKAAAALALGMIRDTDSLEALLELAASAPFAAARSAARAAGEIAPKRVIEEGDRDGAPPHIAEAADRLSHGLAW